jgi:hypothetical protein
MRKRVEVVTGNPAGKNFGGEATGRLRRNPRANIDGDVQPCSRRIKNRFNDIKNHINS